MRKTIALLLATVLLFSCFSICGYAENDKKEYSKEKNYFTEGIFDYTVENSQAKIVSAKNNGDEEIIIPDSLGGYPVTEIGVYAFFDNNSIINVKMGDNLKFIGYLAFSDCPKLKFVDLNKVEIISNEAFSYCKSIESITIPNTTQEIGSQAFSNCRNLKSLVLSSGLKSIGYNAFYNTDLTEVKIPDSVTYIGADAFYSGMLNKYSVDPANRFYSSDKTGVLFNKDKTKLLSFPDSNVSTLYEVPEGVIEICDYAFYNSKFLSSVTLPESLIIIGYDVFGSSFEKNMVTENGLVYLDNVLISSDKNCDEIYSLIIRNGTKYICPSAIDIDFNEITFPDSLIYIGENSINDYYWQRDSINITLPENIKYIGDFAFGIITEEIYIPASVSYLGAYAFTNCDITISEDNPNYIIDDGAIYNLDKTKLYWLANPPKSDSFAIPDSVEVICDYAFYSMYLQNITLPQGLKEIGKMAFCENYIEYFDIPNTTEKIGVDAFLSCDNCNVIIPESVNELPDIGFQSIDTVVIKNPDCKITNSYYLDNSLVVCGAGNSTAEEFANQNGLVFIDLTGEHNHIFLKKIIKYPTCVDEGTAEYSCPCGKSETYTKPVEALGHIIDVNFPNDEIVCSRCGQKINPDEEKSCDCICHDTGIKGFLYRFIVIIWRIFDINKTCECGERHY